DLADEGRGSQATKPPRRRRRPPTPGSSSLWFWMVCSYSDSFSQASPTSRSDRQIVQDDVGCSRPLCYSRDNDFHRSSLCRPVYFVKRRRRREKRWQNDPLKLEKLARGFSTRPANCSVRKDSMPPDLTRSCDVVARQRVLCTTISPAAKTSWQSKLCNTWPANRGKRCPRFSALRTIRWRCYRHSLSTR